MGKELLSSDYNDKVFRIKSIKHSGKLGERGTDRVDNRYPLRIGRTCKVYNVTPAYCACLEYIANADGSDYRGIICQTGMIHSAEKTENGFVLETMNSIWEFEEVKDEAGKEV